MTTTVTSTIRASGGDYTTLSAWEAAKQGNLVTADQVQVAECYDDWGSGLSDAVTIDGSTTDSIRYLKITVASGHRHTGIPLTGFYIVNSTAFTQGIVKLADDYTQVEWLDISGSGSNQYVYYTTAANCSLKNCIGRNSSTSSNVFFLGSSPTAYNCLAYGSSGSANYGFWIPAFTAGKLYNCVAAGCATGFYSGGSNPYGLAKNCVAYNNTTNWNTSANWDAASTNNATSSASDDAPGANSVINVASGHFVNAASNDYHLATGSNTLVGAGVDLSASFTTDIDGQTWPNGSAWDIGFDYRVSSGLTVDCTLGIATADGFTASVDRQLAVAGTLGTATANGFDAQVDRQLTIAGLLGAAIGDGFLADITIGNDLNISGILGVAAADGFNANIDRQISISGSLGQALADGFLANVDLQYAVSGILGTADASGYSASIDRQYTVNGILGTATADGLLAGIDRQYTVSGTLGTATADGYTASVVVAGPSIYNIVYKSAEFTTSLSKSAEFTVSATNRTLRF